VRRKEIIMIVVLLLAGAFGAWRIGLAVRNAWRAVPRRNEDMVLF
jgi:hypothetical protein